ncbi:hypothetical protein MAM1_0398c10307 [Mucor ambiguus]|uniref:Secreted protein n=1 Tax=Mucor ambiguus TaxID=91626 RepID=A0A0C9LY83_9FUNG|nr:hypothetical protein MAM1_0398c10307 [Mucor ambiguus]
MFSQKFQILIISSLLVAILAGVSNALDARHPIFFTTMIINQNLVRHSCLPVKSTDKLDCSFYFDAKKHSLLGDPSNCLVFGYYKNHPPSRSGGDCMLRLPTDACIRNDLAWPSTCFETYYLGTFRLSSSTMPTEALVDNVKIGFFQVPSADQANLRVFIAETDGFVYESTWDD